MLLLGVMCAGAEDRFVSLNVHLMGGGDYVTNNYQKCFPEVSDCNSSMGLALGIGAEGTLRVGKRWKIGTGLNLVRNARRMDMAVLGADRRTASNVFQRNRYYALDIPVFMRWEASIATGVRWNVDCGLYYGYGTGGNQKNTIYDAKINELGQLITSQTTTDAGYYDDDNAFINSYKRADIGLHLATGLTFKGHLTVGLRTHWGWKDVSRSTGIVNPSAHNVDVMALVGWSF